MISILAAIPGIILAYFAGQFVYNIYFHPLRRFPGPFWWRASRLPWLKERMEGRIAQRIYELHAQYGPVVRVAPDELSFDEPVAWKDIYAYRSGSMATLTEFEKARRFYHASTKISPSIVTADIHEHARLRKALSYGFSEKSMREQEHIIQSYVDLLIQRLKEWSVPDPVTGKSQPVDMVKAYNWTTFDIIGDLAFGDPFGCLKESQYHPWVSFIFMAVKYSVVFGTAAYLNMRWVNDILVVLGQKSRATSEAFARQKLKKRMEVGMERPDLIEGLLKKKDEWNIDTDRLVQNSFVLVLAGSETTATLLSGVTYLLCMNPECMEKVKHEVRSTFKSQDEITFVSVNKLLYMFACLNEALRMYPPIPFGLSRTVPKGGGTVAGHWLPGGVDVSVTQWAASHSDRLWKDPWEFHPERFMGDPKYASDQRDALNPFSVGPRNCIGKNLAYAEMRVILAKVLFNFDLTLGEDDKDWMKQQVFVLWEKRPLNVILTPAPRMEQQGDVQRPGHDA